MEPDVLQIEEKARLAVHTLAVANYGDELNAIINYLVRRPINNLANLCEMVDTELAANPQEA